MHDQITEKLDGANVTHQHSAWPKAAEEARGVVLTLERNGSKERVAIGKVVPVIIPLGTQSELVVVLGIVPPFPGRCWDKLDNLVLIEFLDVLLCQGDPAATELEGMCTGWRKLW